MTQKKIITGLMAAGVILCLSACSEKLPQGAYHNEILTTTPVAQDKTMITVRVESGIGQTPELEQALEQKFPDVDFVLVHDGSLNSLYTIRANMENGVECDLLLSRRLPTVADIAEEYLLDLSTEDFVDNYYLSAVDSCTDADGKLYYLPGPSDFYGIVYDKTMFEENGWEVPHSYSEFVELLETIREAGLTASVTDDAGKSKEVSVVPFQASLMYPDMFQILFNTYGYEDTIMGTDNFRWLMAYQQGEGSMVGHMEPAVENFKRLVDDGILSTADWNVAPRTRSTMLYGEHSTAMIIECQNAVSYARTLAGTGEIHELGMMPFWTSDEEDSDYLYTIPSYYIGISRRAAQESKSKKALLLEIVQYISSEEGQKELLSGGLQMSNIKGVSMEKNDFIAEVSDTIDKGNVIATFYYAAGEDNKQVERQMLQTASDMLDGTISVEEWLQGADQARDVFLAGDSEQEEVFGQAKTTLTKLESAYTVAQMYQSVTGAQIGICYGGVYRYGTNGYFYEGDITEDSLACITPDKEADADASDPMNGKVVVAKLTGAQILNILNSVGTETDVNGQYPYYVAYGLTVRFNPWAAEGSRVLSCKLPDGEELDPDETYEVAYFYGSVSDSAIKPERALSQTWQELFVSWLEKQGGVLEEPEMTLELVYDDAQEE